MEQSVESNFFKKNKAIASFFVLKKDFSENPVNLNMGI